MASMWRSGLQPRKTRNAQGKGLKISRMEKSRGRINENAKRSERADDEYKDTQVGL